MSELIFTEAVFFNILNRAKKKVVINLVINARRLLDIIWSEIQIACHVTYESNIPLAAVFFSFLY